MILEEKHLRLDVLAAPDGYAVPSTSEDLAYVPISAKLANGIT